MLSKIMFLIYNFLNYDIIVIIYYLISYIETGDNVNLYEENKYLFDKYILKCKEQINNLNFDEKELQDGFSIYKNLIENELIEKNYSVSEAIKYHRLNMVDVKDKHTMRVVKDANKVCNKINVNDKFKELSVLSALFHDIARFPQSVTSNTFHDYECPLFNGLSHAEYGYKMLYLDQKIKEYQIPKEYYYAIAYAVLHHQENNSSIIKFDNVNELNVNYLTGKESVSDKEMVILATISQLVRDVDKLDILYQHTTNEFPVIKPFIKIEINGKNLDDICKRYDIDKKTVKEYNRLSSDDISKLDFLNIPTDYINLNKIIVPNDIKEVFFNNGFLDLKTLQKRDDYTFIVGMWWRLNHFLNDINFVANLEILKDNNLLEKIYNMFPLRYKFLVRDAFVFANDEILDKKIKENNGKIYVKR